MRPLVCSLIAIALVALAIGAGGAAAQDVQNETADNETEESTVVFDLDDNVRVLSIDYQSEGGVLEVTVENSGDSSEIVHLVEIVEQGAESWGWASPRIRAGETTTITLEGVADRSGDEAAMITTDTALEEQSVQWITTGQSNAWFDGPATWGLMGLGAVATGGGTFWGVRKYLAKREETHEERQVEVVR